MVMADFVFGCDGAYSVVRREMLRKEPIDFSQFYIQHGYKELSIPAAPAEKSRQKSTKHLDVGGTRNPYSFGIHQLPREYLHIWPRKRFMLIALPNMVFIVAIIH